MKSLRDCPIPTPAFTTGTTGNGIFSKADKFSADKFSVEVCCGRQYSRNCPCSSASSDTLGDSPRLIETNLWCTFVVTLGGEISFARQSRIRLSDERNFNHQALHSKRSEPGSRVAPPFPPDVGRRRQLRARALG